MKQGQKGISSSVIEDLHAAKTLITPKGGIYKRTIEHFERQIHLSQKYNFVDAIRAAYKNPQDADNWIALAKKKISIQQVRRGSAGFGAGIKGRVYESRQTFRRESRALAEFALSDAHFARRLSGDSCKSKLAYALVLQANGATRDAAVIASEVLRETSDPDLTQVAKEYIESYRKDMQIKMDIKTKNRDLATEILDRGAIHPDNKEVEDMWRRQNGLRPRAFR